MNNLIDSKKAFLEIKKEDISQNVSKNVDKYLLAIESKIERFSISGAFIFSASYDKNINSGIEEESYLIPKYDILVDGMEPISGYSHQEIAVINTKYEINDQTNIGTDFMIFSKMYEKYHDKNIFLTSITPKIEHKRDKTEYSFAIPIDRLEVQHEISATSISFQPKVKHAFNKDLSIETYYKFQKKFNEQEKSRNSDSKVSEVSLSINYKSFNTSFVNTNEMKIRGENTDINKNAKKLSFGYTYILDKNSLSVNYSIVKTLYKDLDQNFLSHREDKSTNIGISFSRPLSKTIIMNLSATKTKNKSNQAPYNTENKSISAGITKAF
jgi:hypothetical protein